MTSRTIKTPRGYDVRFFENGLWRHIPSWKRPHMTAPEADAVVRWLEAEWFTPIQETEDHEL